MTRDPFAPQAVRTANGGGPRAHRGYVQSPRYCHGWGVTVAALKRFMNPPSSSAGQGPGSTEIGRLQSRQRSHEPRSCSVCALRDAVEALGWVAAPAVSAVTAPPRRACARPGGRVAHRLRSHREIPRGGSADFLCIVRCNTIRNGAMARTIVIRKLYPTETR